MEAFINMVVKQKKEVMTKTRKRLDKSDYKNLNIIQTRIEASANLIVPLLNPTLDEISENKESNTYSPTSSY